MKVGTVAIGRNEGERLHRCLNSLSKIEASATVYVDSGSTDGSVQWARTQGIEVLELDTRSSFTAARARNAGLGRLREMAPDLTYVQFIDADCELVPGWCEVAATFLDMRPSIVAVAGRLRERAPHRSVYNWLCDQEWNGPTGEIRACGGVAMMRIDPLITAGGFREDLIAGEEPELCVRLRASGWQIWRVTADMAWHDAAMTRFSQWWKRAIRTGYAFAQGAHLHGKSPQRHRIWESRRAWLWGVAVPICCLLTSVLFQPWGLAAWLIYPLQISRQILRIEGPPRRRVLLAWFQMLARFPECWGQMKFLRHRLLKQQPRLIEHK